MKLRGLTSALVQRWQFARQHGITFEGYRDLYAALGYARELTVQDYRDRYNRGGLAARLVEAFPRATWRGTGELVEDEDPDKVTEFEQAWNDLNNKLKVWSTLMRADILAGLGQYAVVLIGGKGEIDQELAHSSAKDLLYLQPFAEDDASIQTYDIDPGSERFGMPETYMLKRVRSGVVTSQQFGRSVHWTRIIHIADSALEDGIFGTPRLQRCWNYFDDLEKVVGAGAEAFWLRAHQGYQFNLSPEMTIEPGSAEETALKDEVDEFVHGMRRFVRTQGVELKTLGSDVANFNAQVDAILTLIAGATGIPKRILTGSEQGQLASSQDRSNWRDQVQDRRDGWASPLVVRPLVDRLVEYGYLPEPEQYEVRWPTIQFLDEVERADVAMKWADINAKYGGEVVIEPNEIRDRLLELEPLVVRAEPIIQPAPAVAPGPVPEGMEEAEEEAPPPPSPSEEEETKEEETEETPDDDEEDVEDEDVEDGASKSPDEEQ
jgi:hypothetical protein